MQSEFCEKLLGMGYHCITPGLWCRVRGAGLETVAYCGKGKWIIETRQGMLTGLTAAETIDVLDGTKKKNHGD